MAEASDRMQILYQNLKDAGCGQRMVQKCMELIQEGKNRELMLELSRYKKYLLSLVHTHQKEIDCLDYLVYTLERK